MAEVKAHCGQHSVVRECLLSADPRRHQSRHHGHREATQPDFGLFPEPQRSGPDPHLHVVVLILVVEDKNAVTFLSNES